MNKNCILLILALAVCSAKYSVLAQMPQQIAQQAYVKASNTESDDNFGYSVAISGNTMVVGAPFEDSNATGIDGNQTNNGAGNSGAAYVFVREGTNWAQQAYLKASWTESGDDRFGYKVAIDGDTIVVSAIGEDSNATGVNGDPTNNLAYNSGAAYVFFREGTNWTQQAYLKASNTGVEDYFGAAVAISGNTIVVGADREDSNATVVNGDQTNNLAGDAGAAYVFVREGTNWTQQAYLKASNARAAAQFGWSVAASRDTVVVGSTGEMGRATGVNGDQSLVGYQYAGAAYVFVRSGTNWTQQAYLKASNTKPGYYFGESVAVSGDTVVVGSDWESSNATGVNGNQTNTLAYASGAAYVFVRSGTNWSQQAYLKASNTGREYYFGWSAAIFGDTLVVGSDWESSSGYRSGAAYVFVRSGTNWGQQAYLRAGSPPIPPIQFGKSVALDGETVLVGAPYENSNATGINGDQTNNAAPNSGAAYVYTGFGLRHPLELASDGSGGYWVRFYGVPGLTYRLERSPDLSGPWSSIATNTAPASGFVEFYDTALLLDRGFYRAVTP